MQKTNQVNLYQHNSKFEKTTLGDLSVLADLKKKMDDNEEGEKK